MFFLFFVFVGFMIFLFYNVHYLILLLGLEMILLGISYFFLSSYGGGFDLLGVFFFLLLLVCMGGFSISLLVYLFRGCGSDFWFGRSLF